MRSAGAEPDIETSVVVVGAGPVGLAMAAELGWRGVPVILVERRDGRVGLPRMNGVNARTMEFCRRWGIAQRVRDAGWPKDFPRRNLYKTSLTGYEFHRVDFGLMGPPDGEAKSPEHFQRCSQMWFDPLLRDFAAEFPSVELRYECELDSFADHGDSVVAEVTSLQTSRRQAIRARYLVACDGARSGIRETLGIGVEGSTSLSREASIYFRSDAPLKLRNTTPATMVWLIGPGGMWGLVSAVDGRDLWRLWLSQLPDDVDAEALDANAYVRAAIGTDARYEIVGVAPWTRQEAVAERYREGRVFLAGDAAHTLTPTGGFGMNTGIQDAVDLGWKLAGVFSGWADPRILDSYELERRPVGVRNAREATYTFNLLAHVPAYAALLDESGDGEVARESMTRYIEEGEFAREFKNEGIVLGYRYDDSPICIPDGSPAPSDDVMSYVPTARPGARAPHVWLEPGRSTLDLFGRGFTLMELGPEPPSTEQLADAAASRGVPLDVVRIADTSVLDCYEQALVLVRPDGHVAWRSDALPSDPAEVMDVVRGAHGMEASLRARSDEAERKAVRLR
jgi:2-polyprenyl-6-methoxyphenol hydroxylase-like FAD-dependent oxidoreductase